MNKESILSILDHCCDAFTFPMLDNGYVYLAATRLTLFRSETNWAMTIEVFGFSPRGGLPDTMIYTFGSELSSRKRPQDYVSREAYDNYLTNNPHNESSVVHPIEEGDWMGDEEDVLPDAREILVRGIPFTLPQSNDLAEYGIECTESRIQVFELCRYLAALQRKQVLATWEELRVHVPPDLTQILQLDEWHHPNVVDEACRPSNSETFQQLAEVLVTGDISAYQPTEEPNTHWSNWPDGGTL